MPKSRFFERDRTVQERWYRMKLHQKFGQSLKRFFLSRLHRKLQKEFRAKDKVIQQTIETTVREHKKVDGNLFPATKLLLNISLYFLLAEHDMQALKADAFAHPNTTKRNIALRTLLLTIYELDMGKVTGKQMNQIYSIELLTDATRMNLVEAIKSLKKTRRIIESQLSEARHNTIAHREPDAILQYEIIRKLDIRNFEAALTDFYMAAGKLLAALTLSLNEANSKRGLLMQLIKKPRGT
ncbi:hypothetical protein L2750_02195 [Shewanella submarina]|uniref:Uncharacterized protein n=1 Tax=Shewanella submarina TaxID=2016376 RepID=A0ABV7GJ39_9GAMM|nr:hypothetical protein [Shewanella submarina]MCL1035972.1 hypothetical protein [Shewanella submarina]